MTARYRNILSDEKTNNEINERISKTEDFVVYSFEIK